MRFLPGWFAANAHQVDGVIAYNDGSTDGSAEFVAAQPSVIELLHRPDGTDHTWDEPAIHRAMMEAAGHHDADWLVAVDADERLEERFGARVRDEIIRLSRRGIRAASVRMLELWDAPDQARVDGIWGRKRPVRLFAWRPDAVIDQRSLHGHWAPLNSSVAGRFAEADLFVYHLRMIHETDRLARRLRYETLDPGSEFQRIGYAYLTDPSGLIVEPLVEGRGYRPLHHDPEIAVVVMAVGNPPELRGAVASVLDQDLPAEVVVVNTGGGHAAATVGPMGVRVVETRDVRYVGAARNLGIASTRAPIVAFLAADCRAEPGWLSARLAAHRAGARAVASSLTNGAPKGVVSWASYGLLSVNRMPTLSADRALRYGASYNRELLGETGPFREDLRTGEDTDYHERIGDRCPIEWCPTVRTAHLHPTSMRGLLLEQYRRGQHLRAEWWHLSSSRSSQLPLRVLAGLPRRTVRAVTRAEPGTRARVIAAAPLIVLGGLSNCLGTISRPAE